jgi:glucose-1-phosphate thymidylyltransferase
MIYYPLSTLMLTGIRDILLISTPEDLPRYEALLGDGSQWGLSMQYLVQPTPGGLAQAFTLGRDYIGTAHTALVLGDNIFYGHEMSQLLVSADRREQGATIFSYRVHDPERYGVVEFNSEGKAVSLEEKPLKPRSRHAITGLYFYDNDVIEMAASLKPSARGELEITDINKLYLQQQNLHVEQFGRGMAWLDTGTHETLLEASAFIETIERRQGLKVACPEEIALRMGYIGSGDVVKLAEAMGSSSYAVYLKRLIAEEFS